MHGERHGEAFEQQREAGARPCPWNSDEADAAFGAGDARRAGGQKRLMLEEVEVSPGLLDGVVHPASVRVALGTIEAAAGLEVEPDIEAAFFTIEIG